MNLGEILFLLAIDGGRGVVSPKLERSLDFAMAGALLMELALQNRIDTDLTCIRPDPTQESRDPLLLRVVDKTPTGDDLLDEILKELQSKSDPRPTYEWLKHFAAEGRMIRGRLVEALAAGKILEAKEERKMLFFKTCRYRLLDSRELDEIKARLKELVLGDEIPSPREAVLVSIANFCRLFDVLLSPEELDRVRTRINAIGNLDLIGQAMAMVMREIGRHIAGQMKLC